MSRLRSTVTAAALLALAALGAQGALAGEAPASSPDNVLRVCADPNNMPLSNRKGEGYENRIAELLAQDLGWKLEYVWFPQRMGFIRHTLKARDPDQDRFKCDLVMGVPVGYEMTLTTPAYYHSTWAMVIPKGKGLDGVRTPDDLLKIDPQRLKKLRFGLVGRTPPTDWLLKNHLFDQAESVPTQSGDPEDYPGQMIDRELSGGHIDVAFAWGPIAGYFAQHAGPPGMTVVPFPPDPDIKFDYRIAMGVRRGEKEWRDRIAGLIERDKGRIEAILSSYGVPLLDDRGNLLHAMN